MITLGNLYRIYDNPTLDQPIRDKVIGSLEKRWAAADQDPFILSILLNPYLRGRGFKTLSRMDLLNMAERVFARLFEREPGFVFMGDLMDYCEGMGRFSDINMRLDMWKARFEGQVSLGFKPLFRTHLLTVLLHRNAPSI